VNMTATSALANLLNLTSLFQTRRRRAIVCLFALFFWTKVGVPNALYALQYLDCIIRMAVFKKKIRFAASTAIYKARVLFYDIDWWGHQNNAAYLRHAELARVDYFLRSNFWNQLNRQNYAIAFVAVNVRYRRELRLFKSYQIETRPLFWDDVQLIVEQRFVDPETDFVHTIVYGKYVLVRDGRKVKRSMNGVAAAEGLHTVQFYEDSSAEDQSPRQEAPRKIKRVASADSLSSLDGIAEDHSDAEQRRFGNTYQCRNEIPHSLTLWMQSLEKSSSESRQSRKNLLVAP